MVLCMSVVPSYKWGLSASVVTKAESRQLRLARIEKAEGRRQRGRDLTNTKTDVTFVFLLVVVVSSHPISFST